MARTLDFHVALPEGLARSMDRVARARGMKRAEVLRLALERFLAEAAREARDTELRRYVADMAPHSGEFVRRSAAAVHRLLLEETEW